MLNASIIAPSHIEDIIKNRVTVVHRIEDHPKKLVRAEAWLDGSFLLADCVKKPINESEFDIDLGVASSTKAVIEKAKEKLWELEGYCLFLKLYKDQNSDFKSRLLEEYTLELDRVNKLSDFLSVGKPSFISEGDWADLQTQEKHQRAYVNTLKIRIDKLQSPEIKNG